MNRLGPWVQLTKQDGAPLNSLAEALADTQRNPYDTVFIVGTGVVEGGWAAVNDAMERALGAKWAADAPIHQIAYLTFVLRLLIQNNRRITQNKVQAATALRERLKRLSAIRKSIGVAFRERQKDGRLYLNIAHDRDYVRTLGGKRSLIITTNWDTLLTERYTNSGVCGVIYLHGNIDPPAGVYLPTEAVFEPYKGRLNRSGAYMRQVHRLTLEVLERAAHVIIWGNSLADYDAELCTLIADSFVANRQCKYTVINPSKEPIGRLRALLGDVEVDYVNPLRLVERVERMYKQIKTSIHAF